MGKQQKCKLYSHSYEITFLSFNSQQADSIPYFLPHKLFPEWRIIQRIKVKPSEWILCKVKQTIQRMGRALQASLNLEQRFWYALTGSPTCWVVLFYKCSSFFTFSFSQMIKVECHKGPPRVWVCSRFLPFKRKAFFYPPCLQVLAQRKLFLTNVKYPRWLF